MAERLHFILNEYNRIWNFGSRKVSPKTGGSPAFSDLLEKKRHPGIFSSEEALKSLLIFSNFEHKMDTNRWYFLSMNDIGQY